MKGDFKKDCKAPRKSSKGKEEPETLTVQRVQMMICWSVVWTSQLMLGP